MKTPHHPRFRPSLIGRAAAWILGLCLAFTAAHAQVVPPPGLVSWWPGEGNGRDLQDANDGGAYGAGKVGRAFQLDGARGYVRTADSPSWDFGANDFTFDGWIYTATPNATARLISAGARADGANNLWTFGWGGNRLNFAYWNGSGYVDFYSNPITIPANTWHHIAVARSGSTLSFYFDGAAVGAPNIGSVAINGGSTGVIIGARYDADASNIIEVVNGRIDEVDLFSRALSPSEIQGIYNSGSTGKTPGSFGSDLVSWWRGEDDAKDAQGNHHGINPVAYVSTGKVGQAFRFDGSSSSRLVVPTSPSLEPSRVSVDAWVRLQTTGVKVNVLAKSRSSAPPSYGLEILPNGAANFFVFTSPTNVSDRQSTTQLSPNVWYHLAGTWDGTTARIYVNGTEEVGPNTGTSGSGAIDYSGGADFTIGSRAAGVPLDAMNGDADEVDVFNRALAPAEIQAIYNAGAAGKLVTPPGAGLVSWWRGQGDAMDFQGPNHGTLQNGTGFATGEVGQAFNLSAAASNYVSIPDSPSLRVKTFTIDAWVNFKSVSGLQVIFGKALGVGNADSYALWYVNGALHGYTEGAAGASATLDYPWSPSTDVWHHVAYTFDGHTHSIYVDGAANPATGPNTSPPGYDTHPMLIGADSNNEAIGYFFDGKIDEVDLFDHALSPAQIQAIVDAGAAGKSQAPSASISDVFIAPAASSATFTVSVVRPNATAITVDYTTLDSTAVAPGDYTATSGTLTIPANATSATITVPVTANVPASLKTFFVNLRNPTNAVINRAYATGTLQTSDAAADFSISNGNSNGFWKYGWSPTPTGALTLYSSGFVDGNGNEVWFDPGNQSGSAPGVYHNPSATPHGPLPAGCASFHPGINGEFSHYVWTAPADGSYAVTARFIPLDTGGTDVHVLHNTASLFSGNVTPGNPQTFDGTVTVVAGDRIDFAVGNGGNGYANDLTGIVARITPAAYYDAVRNFSAATNANTQMWQYGYTAPAPDGTGFTRYPGPPIVGVPGNGLLYGWRFSGGSVLLNPTSQNQGFNSNTVQQPDELGMFPITSDGSKAVVRWTAPAAGTYLVKGRYRAMDTGHSDGSIVQNGNTAPPLFNQIVSPGNPKPFSMQVTVAAGDTLDFRVGLGDDGPGSDGTGLAVSIVLLAPSLTPTISNVDFPFTGGQLAISGGTGPYTVTVSAGSLPAGISISSSGLVTGTAANGAYSFTLHVVDSLGAFSDRSFSGTLENPVPVPPSIIAWWSGENAVGEIIGGYHGSLQNGATYGAGKVGRAFSFDGVNDFVQVADANALNLAGDFTIEGWIYYDRKGSYDETIISKWSGDANNVAYCFGLNVEGRPYFYSVLNGNMVPVQSTSLVAQNTWVHLAVTLSGGQVRFYMNGTLTNTEPYTATRPVVNAPVAIGAVITDFYPASSPVSLFYGRIDELSLYSRALGAGEIASIAGAGKGGKARYDVARDFSGTTNPNGAWSYRSLPASASMSTYDPTLADTRLLSGTGTPDANGILAWGGSSSVSVNPTDNPVVIPSGGTQYDWLPHGFQMGPGAGSEFAVARWTAPQSGTYAVSGTFTGADTRPTTVDVHIFHNATQLTPADKRAVNSYRGDGVSHTQTITASAGDKVDFVLGAGGNGYNYDSSALAASVVRLSTSSGPEIVVEQPQGTDLTSGVSSIDFGTGNVGVPVVKTFVIRNTGAADLNQLAVSRDGANNSEFALGALGASPLAPGDTRTFTVTFNPSAAGIRNAAIHIASNDADENPFNIAVSGTGYVPPPEIAVEQPAGTDLVAGSATINFGSTIVGGGIVRTFTIKNTGPGPLTGVGATFGGTNAANFTVAAPPAATVAPLTGSTTFTVRFASSTAGAKTATLHIASNDADENPFDITLTATAAGTIINGTFNTSGDVPLTVDGLATAGLTLNLALNFAPSSGTNLLVVNNTGTTPINGAFNGLAEGSKVTLGFGGQSYDFILTYFGGTGNDIMLLWPGNGPVTWGYNAYGEAGDGTINTVDPRSKLTPVAVNIGGVLSGKTVTSVSAGYLHCLALTSDGKVFAWGHNAFGALGNGTTNDSSVPVAVDVSGVLAGKTITAVSAGNEFSMALASDGTVYCWGTNTAGQLGCGNFVPSAVPVAVLSGAMAGKLVTNISAGGYHALVRTSDGRVYGWGNNFYGQLGTNATNTSVTGLSVPVAMDISDLTFYGFTIRSVSAGYLHSVVVVSTNSVYTCGDNSQGQLGWGAYGTSYPYGAHILPIYSQGLIFGTGSNYATASAGLDHSLALTTSGKVVAWGSNGTLGTNDPAILGLPVDVGLAGPLLGKTVTMVSAGGTFSVVLTSDGKLFSWGNNQLGQLGNGTTTYSQTPVPVDTGGALSGKNATFISACNQHAIALAVIPPVPAIVVQNAAGNGLISGDSKFDLGTALPGGNTVRTLTIRNGGNATLTGIAITKDGNNANEFTIGTLGTTTLLPNASTTFNITFTPGASSPRNAVIHIASNDPNKNPFDLALMGTGGVPITTWRQQNFGGSGNTGAAADTADPDHDGVNNLLEFATGGNPNTGGAQPGSKVNPPIVGLQDNMEFFYPRNKQAMAELIFQVEWNDVLSTTGWSSAGVTETILSDDGLVQQVKASIPTGGNPLRYVHLRVTRP